MITKKLFFVSKNKKLFFFLFLRTKNRIFLDNIFSLFYIDFIYLLRIILGNNYISM